MVAVWKASDKRICSIAECISLGSTPQVTKTVTENLAHLVAFARACEWALSDPDARGAPIIIRYVRDYAANVAAGLWRPRKHKPMAAAAQSAFRALRTQRERAAGLRAPCAVAGCCHAADARTGTGTGIDRGRSTRGCPRCTYTSK